MHTHSFRAVEGHTQITNPWWRHGYAPKPAVPSTHQLHLRSRDEGRVKCHTVCFHAEYIPHPLYEIVVGTVKLKGELNWTRISVFSRQGLMPDPVKVAAIINMEDLLMILGMVNYLAKFVPNLSNISAPLQMLSKQDAARHWNATQDQAFSHHKTMLSHEQGPVLQYFNPEGVGHTSSEHL